MKHARDHAQAIWHAGVNAVRADRLIARSVRVAGSEFSVLENTYSLEDVDRVCVVGAGKAAGYLAMELERVLQPIADRISLHGWINVLRTASNQPTTFTCTLAGQPGSTNLAPRELRELSKS